MTAYSSLAPRGSFSRVRRDLVAFAAALGLFAATSDANAQITSVRTVFVIVMDGQNWSNVMGSSSAPYLNGLLPTAAYASAYFTPPGVSTTLPNHLWLEAGSSLGVNLDTPPSVSHQSTNIHLTTLLMNAGISWKTYQEGVPGSQCPVTSSGLYNTEQNPFVYFDDVTSGSSVCLAHVRPYTELAADLSSNTVARYNFIKPDACHSMHQACPSISDAVKQGDLWLSQEVPRILASAAYQTGGALFITWDHGGAPDVPIGMVVLSPFARKGYTNSIRYTHGSALRTFEEILGIPNLLGDAAAQTSLRDLFVPAGTVDTTAATLTWSPSPGATSYKVTRAPDSKGPFSTVASGLPGMSYTDRGLVSGTTYFYSVVAVNGSGESPAAAPVSVKPVTVPPTPTNLTVKQTP